MNNDATLGEARRIAGQSTDDKLDGKQGTEAEQVILRLLEDAGLDYGEAIDLVSTFGWSRWHAGWQAGYSSGRGPLRNLPYIPTKES